MSDPTHDPIRDLETFGSGGLTVHPLDPAQVRRLGDKRRSQRRATIAIAASILAVVGGIIPATLAMTNDGSAPRPPMNTPTPAPTPTPTENVLGLGNIPENFPLDVDAEDYTGDGGEILGPDPAVETLPLELCGKPLLSTKYARGRLAFSSTGPEVRDERALVTYKDEKAANLVWAAVAEQVQTCTTWTVDGTELALDVILPGYDQAVVSFSVTQEPLGGTVYDISQVGAAILVLAHHGEISPESGTAAGAELEKVRDKLAPEMCVFAALCSTWLGNDGSSDQPRTITYPADEGLDGIRITGPGDIDRLRGAPDSFKAFVLATITSITNDRSCTEQDPFGAAVIVHKLSSAGYAVGSTAGCNGHSAIWDLRGGEWTEVLGSNEIWMCADLDRESIPLAFVTACFDQSDGSTRFSGDFGPTSADGVALGMSRAEVLATGATIGSPAPGQPEVCLPLRLPGRSPDSPGVDGYFSSDKGVIMLRADSDMDWSTPEGIREGSTNADVRTAYPDGQHLKNEYRWLVPLTSSTQYSMSALDSGIKSIFLMFNDPGCEPGA